MWIDVIRPNAVVAWLSYFGPNKDDRDRHLNHQNPRPPHFIRYCPCAYIEHADGGPDEFFRPVNAKDIAEEKEVPDDQRDHTGH